jgi:hypothetical protein
MAFTETSRSSWRCPELVGLPRKSERHLAAKGGKGHVAKETFEAPRIARKKQARAAAFGLNTIRPMLKFQIREA